MSRYRPGTSVPIDPDRLHALVARHRYTFAGASECIDRCSAYLSSLAKRRRLPYYTADALACLFNMDVEDLLAEVETVDAPPATLLDALDTLALACAASCDTCPVDGCADRHDYRSPGFDPARLCVPHVRAWAIQRARELRRVAS